MDLDNLLKTKRFLEEISLSVRAIILLNFPELTQQDKEDIDHEVKLKLWKKLSRGKKITNLKAYLSKIIYTTALDIAREKMDSLPVHAIEPFTLDSSADVFEAKTLVDKAVARLPARKKFVLKLHFSGLNIKEIATSLGWRESQVRHLLYRGLSDVKQILRAQRG